MRGKYRILSKVGEGGMAVVYKAFACAGYRVSRFSETIGEKATDLGK